MAPPMLMAADGVTPLRELLARDQGKAKQGSARSVVTGHPSDGLEPAGLAAILRGAEAGDPQRYLELAEQIEEKYPHYLSVLGTRKRQVSQLPISVESASDDQVHKAHAQLVRDWLKRDTVEAELFDILDAVGKGFSAVNIVWAMQGRNLLPVRLEYRDPRWFEFDRVDGRTPLLRDAGGSKPLERYSWIFHTHPAKSGLPIRGGLARPVAWAWMVQSFALKDWVAFCEVYGFPLRLGKYEATATEEQIRTLMRAVANMSRDGAAVIPSSMQMELIAAQSTGSADLYQRLSEYADKSVSKAVLGQTATTDSEGGGLGGSGKEHNDVRGDIERADAKLVAATLNRDLVRGIIDLNFGAPADGKYPQINIGREETEDVTALRENVQELVDRGMKVAASVMRDKLGLPDPLPDEELLQPISAMAGFARPAASRMQPAPTPTGRLPAPANDPGKGRFPGLGARGGSAAAPGAPPDLLGASYGPTAALPAAGRASPAVVARAIAAAGSARELLVGAAARLAAEADAVDRAADALVSAQGRAVLGPMIEPLVEALVAGASFEEAVAILDSAAIDDDALTELLTRACDAAAVAGVGGQFDPGATAGGAGPAAGALS